MRIPKISLPLLSACFLAGLVMTGCEKPNDNANTTATTTVSPPGKQTLSQVPRPQKIQTGKNQLTSRGWRERGGNFSSLDQPTHVMK